MVFLNLLDGLGLDGLGIDGLGMDTPLGMVLLAVAAFVALKAAKLAVKLAMLPVLLAGLYLWLGI
ncbi:MAG TPA: hypothetical protein VM287_12105 [Egibacteraceae bacterium]|nr:hypothetical protein [Egibacteraceae bacterium]